MMNERIYYSREAEERARRQQTVIVILFMALGLGIGAILALLFAPSSGEEVRRGIVNSVEGSLDTGREATGKTLSRLEKEFSELRKRIEERLG